MASTEPETPKQFMQKTLPTKFRPDKAAGFDVVAQLDLTGSKGGKWTITLKDQKLTVAEGTHPSPTLTLIVSDSDFMDMINGKLGTTKAFFTGRIHLKGDLMLALKLRDAGILDFNAKEPSSKR